MINNESLSLDVESMTLQEMQDLLLSLDKYKRYNKLEYVNPYPYQLKFMNASKFYTQRYMRAGNRTGKSYGAAIEFAMHITGEYREWYEGERIKDSVTHSGVLV